MVSILSVGGAIASGTFVVLTTLLILTEIVGRRLFNWSTLIEDEYSGYLTVAIGFFGLAYTLKTEGHVRVNVLISRLSPGKSKRLDGFCSLIACAFISYFAWCSFELVWTSLSNLTISPTPTETPIFIPQLPIFLGLLLFAIALFARGIANIIGET